MHIVYIQYPKYSTTMNRFGFGYNSLSMQSEPDIVKANVVRCLLFPTSSFRLMMIFRLQKLLEGQGTVDSSLNLN